MVYVSVGRVFLRSRVAPVAKRVVEVVNGEPLTVIEHVSRFYKVKTAKGQVGWIEDHAVIDAKTYDAFKQLAAQHKHDAVEAEATLRDELYMHVQPGRETPHFYLLPGNSEVELLERASVSRAQPVYAPLAKLAEPKSAPSGKGGRRSAIAPGGPMEQPGPIMEDWWLARDSKGHIGWLLGSRLDTDVPVAIEGYGGDMRFAGAWPLEEVTDPEAATPDHKVAEYVTALTPYKSGLPYDFDQVRVYTWSVGHHRYETAFELRSIEGFLPVRVTSRGTPHGEVPVFSFEIAGAQGVATDFTGITRPVSPRTLRYELLGTSVRRIGPDLAPIRPTQLVQRRRHLRRVKRRK